MQFILYNDFLNINEQKDTIYSMSILGNQNYKIDKTFINKGL